MTRSLSRIESAELSALSRMDEVADRLSMYATYFDRPELINEQLGRYLEVDAEAPGPAVVEAAPAAGVPGPHHEPRVLGGVPRDRRDEVVVGAVEQAARPQAVILEQVVAGLEGLGQALGLEGRRLGSGPEQASCTGRRRGNTAAALPITAGGNPRSIRTNAPTQGRAGSRHNPRLYQPTLRVAEAQAACSPNTVP